jgi:mRNA-degrading endonuclease RelE of RelBE toxin-antitoxin system
MTSGISVETSPRFERLARKLARDHRDFAQVYAQALVILRDDPFNSSRRHPIKKLTGVREGDAAWRLRLRRFRFRYDIEQSVVELKLCSLRREDTYR